MLELLKIHLLPFPPNNQLLMFQLALEHQMGGPSQQAKVMQLIEEITERFSAGKKLSKQLIFNYFFDRSSCWGKR